MQDAQTRAPLADVVLIRAKTSVRYGYFSADTCSNFEVHRSDGKGRYRFREFYLGGGSPSVIAAFKPGYRIEAGTQTPDAILLEPLANDRATRLEQLMAITRVGAECFERLNGHIVPMLRYAVREAEPLARTPEEREKVDQLMYALEMHTLGEPQATERYEARRRESLRRGAQPPPSNAIHAPRVGAPG